MTASLACVGGEDGSQSGLAIIGHHRTKEAKAATAPAAA